MLPKGPGTLRQVSIDAAVFFQISMTMLKNGEYAASNAIASTFVDSSFGGKRLMSNHSLVEKVLLGIRSFPFLGRSSTLLSRISLLTLAIHFSVDNNRGSLSNMKLRCLRHHVIGCPLFTVGPPFENFLLNFIGPLQQFHWGMLKKKNTECEKVVVWKKTTPNLLFDRSWSPPSSCSLCYVL